MRPRVGGGAVIRLGVVKETVPGEARIALVPETVGQLTAKGLQVLVESGAGLPSGYPDSDYQRKGAVIDGDWKSILAKADIVLKVRPPTDEEFAHLREGQVLVGLLWSLLNKEFAQRLAKRRITAFTMDLIPRISRAQSMDALSSQSNIAGYKTVIIAADHVPKLFPLLMTAAGTIQPAKVLVIGAGVAGLQAIATAKRLGAVVESYDVRPVVKEQVESLGAKFVELPLQSKDAQDSGGYAKAQSEEFLKKQQELLARTISGSDVVISTALVPGGKAPIPVPEEAVWLAKPLTKDAAMPLVLRTKT